MKIQDHETVRSCRAHVSDIQFGVSNGKYYIVSGEYKDLLTARPRIVFINDVGLREDAPKELFDSFENISYRFFRKLNTEVGF